MAAFDDALCKAVFGGLLPEESQRTAVARALGVSPDNPFRLLAALGGDVAGALAFLPSGESPPDEPVGEAAPALGDAGLAALLDLLPGVPMLAGEGGARLNLAGAQGKLPVVLRDGAIAVPRIGEPSTHLIKPEPERFPGLAANEAFCLALARAARRFACTRRISRRRWACPPTESMRVRGDLPSATALRCYAR